MRVTPNCIDTYFSEALALLKKLIEIPSMSGEEEGTAAILESFLKGKDIPYQRKGNNIWCGNESFDRSKPTILLNSHHDTVKPNKGYTRDPYRAIEENEKLFGLGSNDAGGCLVSLIMTFAHFYAQKELPYNLILAATAEEESSGKNGVESILKELQPVDFGMIGEPTEMNMAVAEKGLMVLDATAKGRSGHSARDVGVNAIYEAIKDIEWFKNYRFEKESDYLGPIKMTVTMISSGYQHNIIPDTCEFVVDIRTTDVYSNQQLFELIQSHVKSELNARSLRLNSSCLPEHMPVAKAADRLGIQKFGSPTCSDQAVMNFPTFKMGPGKSERSHTADEFIFLEELKEGIEGYIHLLEELFHMSASF
ncbi:MAG: M20 family metallo-hydrolase [Bacteroidota bacterium]